MTSETKAPLTLSSVQTRLNQMVSSLTLTLIAVQACDGAVSLGPHVISQLEQLLDTASECAESVDLLQ